MSDTKDKEVSDGTSRKEHECATCGEKTICRPMGDKWECAECSAKRFLGGWD